MFLSSLVVVWNCNTVPGNSEEFLSSYIFFLWTSEVSHLFFTFVSPFLSLICSKLSRFCLIELCVLITLSVLLIGVLVVLGSLIGNVQLNNSMNAETFNRNKLLFLWEMFIASNIFWLVGNLKTLHKICFA